MQIAKDKRKFDIKILIYATIITSIIVSFNALSKYQTTKKNKEIAKVAIPVISLNSSLEMNIDSIDPTNENDRKEILFEVTNQNKGELKSEVKMEYNIEVENLNNLPLIFEIYKFNKEKNEFEDKPLDMTANITNDNYVLTPNSENDRYKLIAIWKKNIDNYNDYRYSKTLDCIKVQINGNQID